MCNLRSICDSQDVTRVAGAAAAVKKQMQMGVLQEEEEEDDEDDDGDGSGGVGGAAAVGKGNENADGDDGLPGPALRALGYAAGLLGVELQVVRHGGGGGQCQYKIVV